jgi:hypothetical protein
MISNLIESLSIQLHPGWLRLGDLLREESYPYASSQPVNPAASGHPLPAAN